MKKRDTANTFNDQLILLAEEYTRENRTDSLVCAFVGGSVGRGEADEYSDLDLNFYFDSGSGSDSDSDSDIEASQNILFMNNIIQLHTHALPNIREIYENPLDYRFLQEARSVYDPKGILSGLLNDSMAYFRSSDGQNLMKKQAFEVIDQRLQWTDDSVKKGELLTASNAAKSSWTDSAFCYAYFMRGSVATGSLLREVEGLEQYQEYREIINNGRILSVEGLLESLKIYRSYLRDHYPSNFSLELVQDELASRKAARHMRLA